MARACASAHAGREPYRRRTTAHRDDRLSPAFKINNNEWLIRQRGAIAA